MIREVDPRFQASPEELDDIYLPYGPGASASPANGSQVIGPPSTSVTPSNATGASGGSNSSATSSQNREVPLSAITHFQESATPPVVSPQVQVPVLTNSFRGPSGYPPG